MTLIFSTERYREVMDAYLPGLEQARDAGLDLGRIQSVASFFVSRVDTEVDKRLEEIGTDEALALRGKAAIANARLAYAAYEEVIASDRWRALAEAGANPQRPLWASTGVKNEAYPDTLYVTELVVADTVNTMPEKTMDAFADHGEVEGDTVTGRRQRPSRSSPSSRRSASTSTTCWSCSRSRASTSSRSPGTSWSRPSRADGAGRSSDGLEHRLG